MDDEFEISLRDPGDDGVSLRRSRVAGAADDTEVHLLRAAILHGDRRIPIPADGLVIGRDRQCDLQLMSGLVAPVHARIEARGRRAVLQDLDSSTGTYLNGEYFTSGERPVRSGDSIAIGGEVLYFVTTENATLPPVEIPLPQSQLRMDRPQLTLGRDGANDIVLDHPRVSPMHAEILSGSSGIRIKDVSRGGDGLRVNGRLVTRTFLKTGDEIAIGPFRLVFDGRLLQQRAVEGGMRLDAEGVQFQAGEKVILRPASLTMLPGELVAVIGPSGAGKSTLLKCLCGVHRATAGLVTIDGEPVHSRLPDIGYVPQDEIVHPLLSVREALEYAAELRLPQDTRADERAAAVDRVLEEVGLVEHSATRIAALSGGQRKRAGVATELISQPGMLFLDEPTTGLDPGLEQRLMLIFQKLAAAGRATMVVTHATRSLRLCDRVIVMGEGGHVCFMGPPADALEFFGIEHFDDLYGALEDTGAAAWGERFRQVGGAAPVRSAAGSEHRALPPRPMIPQATVLVRRRLKILSRDTRNLWILGMQVPILALLLALLFHRDVFVRGMPMTAGLGAQLLFLLVTVALWFGSLASAREIVKERGVMQRETAVGVRIPSYLISKGVVLGAVTGLQTLVLALIVFLMRPLHETAQVTGLEIGTLVLTAWAGVAMGLLVSVSVNSEDQAMSLVPLLLIPQLLFGGSIMPVHQMGIAMQVLSKVVVAQWAYAGLGNGIDMNGRITDDHAFAAVSRFGHAFFAIPAPAAMILIVAFAAVCVALLYHRLESSCNA